MTITETRSIAQLKISNFTPTNFKTPPSLPQCMDVPDRVEQTADEILSQYRSQRDRLPRAIETYRAASLAMAAYEHSYPIRISEASNLHLADPKMVSRTKKEMSSALERHSIPPSPESFIERYVSELSLPHGLAEDARDILTAENLVNHHPSTAAAAVLYAASRRNGSEVDRDTISEISGVHKTSITKCIREINDTE